MQPIKQKNWNVWKILFIILVSVNVLVMLFFVKIVTEKPKEHITVPDLSVVKADSLRVEVGLTGADLGDFLEPFIQTEDGTQVPEILIADDVTIQGEWSLFGIDISYVMKAKPFAMENGNMQLRIDQISIGGFSLPRKQALTILGNRFADSVPILVNPEDETIEILLTSIQTDQIERLALLLIESESKEYLFEITFPRESLLQ